MCKASEIVFIFFVLVFSSCSNAQPINKQIAVVKSEHGKTDSNEKYIPRPTGYVNDFYKLFSPEELRSLELLIASVEDKNETEFAIITFDSSYTNESNFDTCTLAISNKWGVGKKDKNNGVVIAVCPDYRRIRIHNGYGIEKIISDDETKKILDTVIIPFFKEGLFYQGIYKAILVMTQKLEEGRK